MRIRAAYAKENEAKFIGHLDLAKVFERALRRADISMCFSEGFNPHPKLSFGSALALGVTSVEEYVDMDIVEDMPTSEFLNRLQAQLPKGITLLDVREVPISSKPLMAVLNCAMYRVRVPLLLPLEQDKLEDTLERFLAQEAISYVRYTKAKGRQEKNLRPFIRQVSGVISDEWLELALEVVVGNEGSLKPIEFIGVLREFGDLPLDVDGTRVHRQGIYVRDEKGIKSPLDI